MVVFSPLPKLTNLAVELKGKVARGPEEQRGERKEKLVFPEPMLFPIYFTKKNTRLEEVNFDRKRKKNSHC